MTDIQTEIKVVAVPQHATLLPNPYNPNQQSLADFELLVKSMEEDGFTLPVVVNDGSKDPALKNMIIDGEHRWRAAGVLGMEQVPVVYKGMDEAEMRASTIRHNTARGHHDSLLEASLIKELARTMSTEELGDQLHIDPVELDMLTYIADETSAMEGVAATIEEEAIAELVENGIPQEEAEIVGKRHAMIRAKTVLTAQDTEKTRLDTGKNVRLEFIFEGEMAVMMREFVREHKTPLKAVSVVLEYLKSKAG